jgi:inhibitor of KinA
MAFDAAQCRFFSLGDQAVTVELGTVLTPELNDRVHALCARLMARPLSGVIDIVPAYITLAVHYNARQVALQSATHESPFDAVVSWIRTELPNLEDVQASLRKRVEIPVCYGGEFGDDLDELAAMHSLTREQVIDLHCAPEYRVHMIGFAPGFAYLGELDARIRSPRRTSPRTHVPAGSVAIGGEQTGVYPNDSPGGWNIIGRTPLRLFDLFREPTCLLAPGDRVRFIAIDRERYDAIARGE